METSLKVTPLVHEIRIRNQVIYLDPPIELARANWYQQLHEWLGESRHSLSRSAAPYLTFLSQASFVVSSASRANVTRSA